MIGMLLLTVEHAGGCRVHHGAAAGDGRRRQVVADATVVHRGPLAPGLDQVRQCVAVADADELRQCGWG